MTHDMSADDVVADCFRPLIGQPCWGVYNGYGSWLTLNFGTPHLEIREPNPESDLPTFRMRAVHVKGDHQLWINMAQWRIFQDGAAIAHNESERDVIGRAAAGLDGQVLLEAKTQPNPPVTEFTFDLGGRLWVSRYGDWEADHGLWHLTSGETINVLHADGRVVVERPSGEASAQTDYGCIGI